MAPPALRARVRAIPVETPQPLSWLSNIDTVGVTMSSALRFIAAAAIVMLFGGFLLASVMTTQHGGESVPAAPGASMGTLAVCPPDATPDQPGPVDQARPPHGQPVAAAFDRAAGKIVYLAVVDELRETWLFDVCTNTWSLAQQGADPGAVVGAAIYDPVAERTILVDHEAVWSYHLPTNTWAERQPPEPGDMLRLAFDSGGGHVVGLSLQYPYPMWSYDAASDLWYAIEQKGAPVNRTFASHTLFTYEGHVGRLFAYGWNEGGYLFDDEAGTWEPTAKGPDFSFGGYISWGGEIVYDEGVGRIVLSSDGHVIAYDATADGWETLFDPRAADGSVGPARYPQGMHGRLVYDPVNERIVSVGGDARVAGTDTGWAPRDDVWAFDAQTREWMELLPSAARESE
jgi:hypothetical protein